MQLCVTQWRIASNGQRIGYDYAGVKAAIEIAGENLNAERFEKLRVIEAAFIQADHDRREREKKAQPNGDRSPPNPARRHGR